MLPDECSIYVVEHVCPYLTNLCVSVYKMIKAWDVEGLTMDASSAVHYFESKRIDLTVELLEKQIWTK